MQYSGFLGINSATMREAAVQTYIPDNLRARINAFEDMIYFAASAILSLLVGLIGEVLDYRICVTLCGTFSMLVCFATILKNKKHVDKVYNPKCG